MARGLIGKGSWILDLDSGLELLLGLAFSTELNRRIRRCAVLIPIPGIESR